MDDPSFLLPGTRTWRPAPSCPHPHFGWILTCQVTDIECFPLVATHAESLPPWIPLAIVTPPHLIPRIEAGVRLFDTARHGQTAMISHTVASPPSPEVVLQGINTRPAPTIALLAEWLAHRLGHPEHLPLLQAAMAPAGASTNHSGSRRTIQRLVQAEFEAHASDFRRVVRIARQERLSPSVSRLADLAGTTEARLRLLVRTLLGVSLSFYNLHPGWEWVLEAACRQGLGAGGWGLIEDSCPPPRHPGLRVVGTG